MRKVIFLLGLALLCQVCSAQSPLAFPYQAVARDSFGTPIPDQAMRIRLTIHDSSATGPIRYRETDSIITDNLGMFTVNIGEGTVDSGTFSNINWGSAAKYLQVELDPAGGTSYINMGASQLLSVPFALHSGSSGNLSTVPYGQIPYGDSNGLRATSKFARDPGTGNTHFVTPRNGKFYGLDLGDSVTVKIDATNIPTPSAILVYGDSADSYGAQVGVGQIPAFGINATAFMRVADDTKGTASINVLNLGAHPDIILAATNSTLTPGRQGIMHIEQDAASMVWHDASDQHVHGIYADSNKLKIYSSPAQYAWTWPNAEGLNGQALVTDGSGNLSWGAPVTAAAGRILYSNGSGITSDANFTRGVNSGNTRIKTVKGDSYYALELGDSVRVGDPNNPMNMPSASLIYGDTSNNFTMSIGVGKVPAFGMNKMGYLNLTSASGATSNLVFLESGGEPGVMVAASRTTPSSNLGSKLQLTPNFSELLWRNDITNKHGIVADSLRLKLYSSLDSSQRFWTWPNTEGTSGQALTTNGSGTLGWSSVPKKNRFGITIDGLGDVITTGSKGFTEIPYNGTITGWTIVADQAGSCVIDVKRSNYASFPTTTSIAGTALPTLSTAQKNQNTTLSGWGNTAITGGDMFEFIVNSATTVKRVTLIIETTME